MSDQRHAISCAEELSPRDYESLHADESSVFALLFVNILCIKISSVISTKVDTNQE